MKKRSRVRPLIVVASALVALFALTVQASPGDEATWTVKPDIRNVKGNYTPLVITGANQIRVYANTNGSASSDGTLFMRSGSFTSVGKATAVILPSQITDQTGKPFIRTTGVVRAPSGKYYAVLHVGDSYPSPTGYVPAWATSNDGVSWTYRGKFRIDGTIPYVYSSGASLIVQEEKPAVLDTFNPINNRYLVWEDAYSIDGVYKRMVLVYSADGVDWRFYRNALGEVIDVWPNDPSVAADQPVFPTTTKTPYGFHLIAGDRWPTSFHRHLYSCDGLTWRVIEIQADTYAGPKGTNLAYEATTGLIHALTSASHFTLPAQAWSCP